MRRVPWILLAITVTGLAWWAWDRAGPADEHASPTPDREASPASPAVLRGVDRVDPRAEAGSPPLDLPFPAPAMLEVRVVDASGRTPIADARLTLRGAAGEAQRRTTDASGTASFEDAPPGAARLRTAAEGRVPSATELLLEAGATERATVVLATGHPATGHVLSLADGSPVSHATVFSRRGGSVDGTIVLASDVPFDHATTDLEGRFSFPALPDDVICTLRVEAPGFQTLEHAFCPGQQGAPPLVLRLEPGGSLSGLVISPDGEPVGGARVFLDCEIHHGVNTDEAGRYRIDGLQPSREYRVNAAAAGYAESADVERVLVTTANPRAILDLTLRRLSVLWLDLVDEQGTPVTTDCESSLGPWPVHGWLATRDGEVPGRWRFDEAEPGRQRLQVRVSGFLAVDRYALVAEGETTVLVVELVRGTSITGVVVDDLGRPVAGCRMTATTVPDGCDAGERTETDPEGRFRLRGLAPRPHVIHASADGHVGPTQTSVEASEADVRIELVRCPRITFRLRPPAGATTPERFMIMIATDGGGSGTGLSWTEETVESWALPGPCQARIEVEGFATWKRDLDLGPGEEQHLGVVALDAGVSLRVEVRDGAGTPIPGATVTLLDELTIWRLLSRPLTQADGACTVEHLNPGAVRLEVEAAGFTSRTVEAEVRSAGGSVRVALEREQ